MTQQEKIRAMAEYMGNAGEHPLMKYKDGSPVKSEPNYTTSLDALKPVYDKVLKHIASKMPPNPIQRLGERIDDYAIRRANVQSVQMHLGNSIEAIRKVASDMEPLKLFTALSEAIQFLTDKR